MYTHICRDIERESMQTYFEFLPVIGWSNNHFNNLRFKCFTLHASNTQGI